MTGLSRDGGYFDNNQWDGVLPRNARGVLHTVASRGLIHEGMQAIQDGTSNTLMVGEYMSKTTTRRGTFWAYSYTCYALGSCGPEARLYIPDYDLCGSIPGNDGSNACKRAFASFHPAGMNFAFADASVRFLATSTMDIVNVLQPMATMCGGEK